MMAGLYNAHLKVYYEGDKDSVVDALIKLENDHQDDFGHAGDGFAVYQRLKIVLALDHYARDHYRNFLCPPALVLHIQPKVVCEWNSNKNSIDVTSRLISTVMPKITMFRSPALSMYVRVLLCALVNVHRFQQITAVIDKLKSREIKSISTLNSLRNKSRTFKSTVHYALSALETWIQREPEPPKQLWPDSV